MKSVNKLLLAMVAVLSITSFGVAHAKSIQKKGATVAFNPNFLKEVSGNTGHDHK